MSGISQAKAHANSIYRLSYRLVLSCEAGKPILSESMLTDTETIVRRLSTSWGGELIAFKGEADHVQISFEAHPRMELARFVNTVKTVTSRLLRRDYPERLQGIYDKPVLWSSSYCIVTTNANAKDVINRYLENTRKRHGVAGS